MHVRSLKWLGVVECLAGFEIFTSHCQIATMKSVTPKGIVGKCMLWPV